MKKKKRISIRLAIATMLIGCMAVGGSFAAVALKIKGVEPMMVQVYQNSGVFIAEYSNGNVSR